MKFLKCIASVMLLMFSVFVALGFGQAISTAPAGGIDTPKINHLVICDSHYASIQVCITAAGTNMTVIIPFGNHVGETYTNPNGITIADFRTTSTSSNGVAGQDKEVQLNKGGSAGTDTGKFIYDYSQHMLKSGINGQMNSDLYNTANNGVASALAAPECGANCQVYQPPTSTDTAAVPIPASGKSVVSDRGAGRLRVFHNPAANPLASNQFLGQCVGNQVGDCLSGVFDTPDPSASSIPTRPVSRAIAVNQNQWGFNYGNAPGASGSNWTTYKVDSNYGEWNTQGITQNRSDQHIKHATGDAVFGQNIDNGYTDGGSPDFSAEGPTMFRAMGGETSNYYHGIAGTGAATGATSLPVSYNSAITTNNRDASSSGAFVIDVTKGTIFGTVTGLPTALTGYPTGVPTIGIVPIDTPVTPSTAYGNLSCTLDNNHSNPNLYSTATCNITNLAGTSGVITNGRAYLAGDFPEEVVVSGAGSVSGGTQSITLTYLHPHGADRTTIWQGSNVIGQFISYDRYFALNGFREEFHVYGATDSTHLVVEQATPSGGVYAVFIPPLNITTLAKSGTTVTAKAAAGQVNNLYNKQASVVVAGCSDASLNGTVTNVAANVSDLTMSWTQAAGGTGCATATMSLPASAFGFHLYPGAEQLGPAVDSPTSIALGVNSVPWASGDLIEIPHHPMFVGQFAHYYQTINNPFDNNRTQGIYLSANGAGINGHYNHLVLANTNPCSWYQGCGGTLDPPAALYLGYSLSSGINGGLARLATPPLPGKSVITIGPPDSALASNTDPYRLFITSQASSQFEYHPATNDYVANAFAAGLAGSYGRGFFRGGHFWVTGVTAGDSFSGGGVYFSKDGTNELTRMGICNSSSSLKEITFGTCTTYPGLADANTTDGKINVASIRAQTDATLASVTVGLQPPTVMPNLSYTGTVGSTQRVYYYAVVSPLGIQGPPLNGVGINNTATTLDASNFVTITCPTTLQSNWPAGSTYRVLYRSSVPNSIDLGACPIGGTVKDDGSLTNGQPGLANINQTANMWSQAGQYLITNGGGLGYLSSNRPGGSFDTWLNRIGVGKFGIGSQMGISGSTSHDGSLQLANITVDSLAGTGFRCVHTDSNGVFSAASADCPTGSTGSTIAPILVTITGATLTANTCSTEITAPMTGVVARVGSTPGTVFDYSFDGDPSGITGWGAVGGISLVEWPTTNTYHAKVCNVTGSSITYGTVTINVGAK